MRASCVSCHYLTSTPHTFLFFFNFQLTAIKAVQTSNVQLDTSDSVARAISDASANMRPSTSLMLAEVIADVKNGRHFAETGEISKLLE